MTTFGDVIKNVCKICDIPNDWGELLQLHEKGMPPGISTGWPFLDNYFKILKGQLNVVGGWPGTGKTEWVDSLFVNLVLSNKWNCLMFSPESYPLKIYKMDLIKKLIGKNVLTKEELGEGHELLRQHFFIMDPGHDDDTSFDTVLKTAEYLINHENKHIDLIKIDPWNDLEGVRPKGMTETDYIRNCLIRARKFARKHDISFWILAHPAKPVRIKQGKYPEMTLYDLSDSQHWYNKTDNGFVLVRTEEDKVHNDIVKVKISKVKRRYYGRPGEVYMEYNFKECNFKSAITPESIKNAF